MMKKLKHSKYKNTGILFEMLVRKLTSETLTSDKSNTINIIKKYFGKNTELAKEMKLYNAVIEAFKTQTKEERLLITKLLIDKFNSKYSVLDENQKRLLNKYITHVNDTTILKEYVQSIIPDIKNKLKEHVSKIDDKVTKIKVQRLSEMLCDVENINVIKESHVLNLLRYFDLVKELNEVHK
jgi:hypothetical protein